MEINRSDRKEIAKAYVSYLEKGNLEKVVHLFSKDGKVHSPLYGTKIAEVFYQELGEDTRASKLRIKGIFEEENSNRIALFFEYNWTLKNEDKVVFDVVDIIEFNARNEIIDLQIIYDTIHSREAIKTLK